MMILQCLLFLQKAEMILRLDRYRYTPYYSVVLCLYDSLQDYHCYALGYSAEPGTVFMIISVSKDQPEKILTSDGYIGYAALHYPDIEIAVNNQ